MQMLSPLRCDASRAQGTDVIINAMAIGITVLDDGHFGYLYGATPRKRA